MFLVMRTIAILRILVAFIDARRCCGVPAKKCILVGVGALNAFPDPPVTAIGSEDVPDELLRRVFGAIGFYSHLPPVSLR